MKENITLTIFLITITKINNCIDSNREDIKNKNIKNNLIKISNIL